MIEKNSYWRIDRKRTGKILVFKTIQSAVPAAKRSSAGVATCATGSIVGSKHFMH